MIYLLLCFLPYCAIPGSFTKSFSSLQLFSTIIRAVCAINMQESDLLVRCGLLFYVTVVNICQFVQENNRSELARLDSERRADFLSMLKGFVVNQVGPLSARNGLLIVCGISFSMGSFSLKGVERLVKEGGLGSHG